MPTPNRYEALASRLHGRQKIVGILCLSLLVPTVLLVVALKKGALPPTAGSRAAVVLLFVISGWFGGIYLVCDWFDPKQGYLSTLEMGKTNAVRNTKSFVRWICAVVLDLWLAVLALLVPFFIAMWARG
jgi:hypothetical protein